MDWSIRSVVDADVWELARFACSGGTACADCGGAEGNLHEEEVETYVRHLALEKMAQRREHNGHRMLALVDPSGAIVGVISHERHELRLGGEEVPARRLVAAAIRLDRQGTQLDGHRLSSHLLAAALRDDSEDEPLIVDGLVRPCNARSLALLARHTIDVMVPDPNIEPVFVHVAGLVGKVIGSLPPSLPTNP